MYSFRRPIVYSVTRKKDRQLMYYNEEMEERAILGHYDTFRL